MGGTYVLAIDVPRPTTIEVGALGDRECELAATLPGEQVEGFGASDCDCAAHLLAASGVEAILEGAIDAGGVRADGDDASESPAT